VAEQNSVDLQVCSFVFMSIVNLKDDNPYSVNSNASITLAITDGSISTILELKAIGIAFSLIWHCRSGKEKISRYTRVTCHKKNLQNALWRQQLKKSYGEAGVLLATDYGRLKYFHKLCRSCRCYGRGLWRKGLPYKNSCQLSLPLSLSLSSVSFFVFCFSFL
jgi:hypothetical protein